MGLLIRLALRAEIYKSGRLFPAGFSSGYGVGLNLVDFHKVSLAVRDGFYLLLFSFFCPDCFLLFFI